MARQLRVEYPGAFYHITSRGNEKKKIFTSNRDREKFLDYLKIAHERFKIVVHAFCLMFNHYHLLVETPLANLSRCMQLLNTSYSTYYNKKMERVGHLFQGRYKAILVDKDTYLKTLSRYIHLNPVRSRVVQMPEDYQWSSYRYFIAPGKKPDFLDSRFTMNCFTSKNEYKKFVESGVAANIEDPFEELKAGFILGSDEFVAKIKDEHLKSMEKLRDLPGMRELDGGKFSPEMVLDLVNRESSLEEKEKIKLAVYLSRKYTGETLKDILIKVCPKKMSLSAASQIVSRTEKRRGENNNFAKMVRQIENKMLNV